MVRHIGFNQAMLVGRPALDAVDIRQMNLDSPHALGKTRETAANFSIGPYFKCFVVSMPLPVLI
jgi:fumarylacetoacetate (FAA) hydrolase family protein